MTNLQNVKIQVNITFNKSVPTAQKNVCFQLWNFLQRSLLISRTKKQPKNKQLCTSRGVGWVKRNHQIQVCYFQVWIRTSMQMGLYQVRRTTIKYTLWYRRVPGYWLKSAYSEISGTSVPKFSSWRRHQHLLRWWRNQDTAVRTLLRGVTSKKTAKFTLSAMTETTGMNALFTVAPCINNITYFIVQLMHSMI